MSEPRVVGHSVSWRRTGPATLKKCRLGADGGFVLQSALGFGGDESELTALDAVRVTDRHRIGFVLQGAALLAHLDRLGLCLAAGWKGSGVCREGLLRTGAVTEGRTELPQEALCELMLRLFRAERRIAGRGEGRRIARRLLDDWRQSLSRVDPQRALGGLLREAPFLLDAEFGTHRRALAAALERDGGAEVWVVGPPVLRHRLGQLPPEIEEACELLARDLKPVSPTRSEGAAAVVRRYSQAPPASAAERLELARALEAEGRFSAALALLRGRHGVDAGLVRLRCQHRLHQLEAARRTLSGLQRRPLRNDQLLDLADTALRIHGARGRRDLTRDWIARVLRAGRGKLAARARVLAALGCWDLGDVEAMERHLRAARTARGRETAEVELRQALGLHAVASGQPRVAVEHLTAALASGRRSLSRHQAARLWNDLVLARVEADDLAGAERACRHSLRLFGACEGPIKTTLALYNLAEIRIRRGRLRGVQQILEQCSRENELAGNLRGAAHDAELWARFELARGRPAVAFRRCREAIDELEHAGLDWNRAELELLAVRSLGWRRRAAAASGLLEAVPDPPPLSLFEPEERPALWAHAGRLPEARREATRSGLGALWTPLLQGVGAPPRAWDLLGRLEPYRGARMVLDLYLLRPELVPHARRRWAATVLRETGAVPLARRLEAADRIAPLLERLVGATRLDVEIVEQVLGALGIPEALLTLHAAGSSDLSVLVDGAGGPCQVRLDGRAGVWMLETARPEELARTILGVLDLITLLERRGREARSRRAAPGSGGDLGMIGSSRALRDVVDRLTRLGREGMPILIEGETGSGKELAARAAHAASERSREELVVVNCAALSETLILSDLFGHTRGAFTGADRDRAGVFESAHGGSVFLDEIGDLPLPAQGMLLRALQNGEVRRLGETRVRLVDVRVIAATNRDLDQMAGEGTFRRDLLYRLAVGRVEMPPLRERGDDVLELAQAFLRELGGPPLSATARVALLGHVWPGNVRELRGVLERACALADPSCTELDADLLELGDTAAVRPGWHEWLEGLKRRRLQEELDACGGNRAEAARRLGLTRQALSYLVRQLLPPDPAAR